MEEVEERKHREETKGKEVKEKRNALLPEL